MYYDEAVKFGIMKKEEVPTDAEIEAGGPETDSESVADFESDEEPEPLEAVESCPTIPTKVSKDKLSVLPARSESVPNAGTGSKRKEKRKRRDDFNRISPPKRVKKNTTDEASTSESLPSRSNAAAVLESALTTNPAEVQAALLQLMEGKKYKGESLEEQRLQLEKEKHSKDVELKEKELDIKERQLKLEEKLLAERERNRKEEKEALKRKKR